MEQTRRLLSEFEALDEQFAALAGEEVKKDSAYTPQ